MPATRIILAVLLFAADATAASAPAITITTRAAEIAFEIEIADTQREREIGLQHRRELPADRGLLLVYPSQAQHGLWMKDTPIPLDMLFVDESFRIIGIVENTAPYSTDSRRIGKPSRYVLEINGGLARQHGIRAGDRVRFAGFDPAAGAD